MALHPKAQAWIDIVSSFAKVDYERISVDSYRDAWSNFMVPAFIGDKIDVYETEDAHVLFNDRKVQIRIYRPRKASVYPTLFYLPGGGFIIKKLLETHDTFCRRLCVQTQWQVIAIQYCAAPEAPFPEAINELLTVLPAIVKQGHTYNIDETMMAIAGDSAGANLAAAVMQRLHPDIVSLQAQVLISPPLDALRANATYREYQEGYLLDKAYIDWIHRLYFQDILDLTSPKVSPLYEKNLSRLPPTLIINAQYDAVRDDGEQYAIALARAGVDSSYICYPGLIHAFLLFRGPEALAGTVCPCEDVADFLKQHMNCS